MAIFIPLYFKPPCFHTQIFAHAPPYIELTVYDRRDSVRKLTLIYSGTYITNLEKSVGKPSFSEQFRKLINRYNRIGYSLDIMLQTTCLVSNPIIVGGYASLFDYTTAVRISDK